MAQTEMNSINTDSLSADRAAVSFGNISLRLGLMLSPMAGVTDSAMRILCSRNGAEYAVTEMVSAKALVYEQNSRSSAPAKTAELCRISPDENIPTAVQLFGSDPAFIAEAARLISTASYRSFTGRRADAIDINMGCPVKKVVSCGEGSALMSDPDLIMRIVEATVRASSLPVTVKLRAGRDISHINAPECAAAAEAGGASAVCVHARTASQFYAPGIMMSVIGEVKNRVSVPVFGNGDIRSPSDALIMLRETGCDGVAVGRGSIGNPWIFGDIASAIEKGTLPDRERTPEELLETALALLRMSVAEKGEKRGVAESKYSLSHFVKGLRGASEARARIMSASSSAEIAEALTLLLSGQKGPE